MRTTVYARLFDRLADLIPSLQSARAGAVFCAPPRIPDDMAVYCHIAAAEGDMRLIELADDNQKKGTVMPAPWLKLRVDMANKLAEVLEMEDSASGMPSVRLLELMPATRTRMAAKAPRRSRPPPRDAASKPSRRWS